MRVGTNPTGALEWLLLKANRIPIPVIDSFSGMMKAKAILAANEIGLFATLASGPLSVDEIAHRIEASPRGISDLVDALCASGYLRRVKGRTALTRLSRKWLIPTSPSYVGHMLQHVNDLWSIWSRLELAVLKGGPPASDYHDWLNNDDNADLLRRHILGLHDISASTAGEIVRLIPPFRESGNGQRGDRLLDLGGGHGGYSVAFCRKYPLLSATVFDLKNTVEIGREIVSEKRMSKRVEFVVGDFMTSKLGSGYTGVLYFNIMHNLSEKDNRRLLAKVYDALLPGGTLAIWDIFKEHGAERDMLPALMALHMLVSSGGTSYQIDDVKNWLRAVGFGSLVQKRTRRAPGLTLILARKQPEKRSTSRARRS